MPSQPPLERRTIQVTSGTLLFLTNGLVRIEVIAILLLMLWPIGPTRMTHKVYPQVYGRLVGDNQEIFPIRSQIGLNLREYLRQKQHEYGIEIYSNCCSPELRYIDM